MGDYAVRMQFDIDADPDTILKLLTTAAGVEQWWSRPVEGSPGDHGARFTIAFPDLDEPMVFAVERGDARSLAWRTQEFPPWWADTTIHWQVTEPDEADGTLLVFTHEGFDPGSPIIPIITPAWARFIFGLKDAAEQGA